MMDIDTLLVECRSRSIVLQARPRSVAAWSPNLRVPSQIRAALRFHQREILRRLAQSDISVCPSPDLHRASWLYRERQFLCNFCARLGLEVARIDRWAARAS